MLARMLLFKVPASDTASVAALALDEETPNDAMATFKFLDLVALEAYFKSRENKEQFTSDEWSYTSEEATQRCSITTECFKKKLLLRPEVTHSLNHQRGNQF